MPRETAETVGRRGPCGTFRDSATDSACARHVTAGKTRAHQVTTSVMAWQPRRPGTDLASHLMLSCLVMGYARAVTGRERMQCDVRYNRSFFKFVSNTAVSWSVVMASASMPYGFPFTPPVSSTHRAACAFSRFSPDKR